MMIVKFASFLQKLVLTSIIEIKSMLTGAVIHFFMETITFIPDNKLAVHYLIASDMWGFIVLYTRYPSEFQHELAKAQLLNHWKKLTITLVRSTTNLL